MTPTPLPPIRVTGSGDDTTEPFFIPRGEWEIDWAYQAASKKANFSFFVYRQGQPERYIESIVSPAPGAGSTAVYGGEGYYYVKIIASDVAWWVLDIKRIGQFLERWPRPGGPPVVLEGRDSTTTRPLAMAAAGWDIQWSYEPASEGASFSFSVYSRSQPDRTLGSVRLPDTEGNIHIKPAYFQQEAYVKVQASKLNWWKLVIKPAAP